MAEERRKLTGHFDYIVVGAGLAGSVLARELAERHGKRILMLECRNHVAGNMHDEINEHGIRIQRYGPHTFHTNDEEVYTWITRFCEPIPYRTKCEAVIDDVSTPSPFNFRTIDQFYGIDEAASLKRKLLSYYEGRKEITVVEMLEAKDVDIRAYANFLFEKDYRLYTAKQWDLPPEKIDPSVLKRVPIVLSYRDTYFSDKYEWMPKEGFDQFCKRVLDHPNIKVQLNVDARKHIVLDNVRKCVLFDGEAVDLIYTGPIDALFDYRYGMLPYRSLYFEFRSFEKKSFQNAAIVVYPQVSDYTRITEYTKMPQQDGHGWTSVAYEYPVAYDKDGVVGNEPYYPVLTADSQESYEKYRSCAQDFSNLILCGRLADFRYYNMDQVVRRAFEVLQHMEEKWNAEV